MIEFKNVTKEYKSAHGPNTKALNNISISIEDKGLVFITGKSGSGKSTMLNLLGGLDKATTGEIFINGNDINKFSESEYDSYRNIYIGFIFQEFNILEEYNIYENIALSINLQKKNISKEEIDKLLDKLKISDLGNRKVNELSGGQKQRVAIARALIKKPKIILADEPTGNLDTTSSKQIFDILKEISQNQLVIVVSHDLDSAKKYADRIITIEDGLIAADTKPYNETKKEKLELTKTNLPIKYAFNMAVNSLKFKPSKLILTILVLAISLIFMGITANCALYDKDKFASQYMKDNNQYNYTVRKYKSVLQMLEILELDKQSLSNIEKITPKQLNKKYVLYENEKIFNFRFGEKTDENEYYQTIYISEFVELEDPKILGKLIGQAPTKDNEMVVHKLVAEYIVKYGIYDTNDTLYKPTSINNLIKEKRELKLGNYDIIITGVIDDNTKPLEKIKSSGIFIKETDDNLKDYYHEYINYPAKTVYVKGFAKKHSVKSTKEDILKNATISINSEGFENINFINQPVEIINAKGQKEIISSLEKDEVIISIDALKKADDYYFEHFDQFLKNNISSSYDNTTINFIENYTREKSVLERLLTRIHFRSDTGNKTLITPNYIKIIGVSLDNKNYISNKYIDEYIPIDKKITGVEIYDDNIKSLNKTLSSIVIASNYIDDIQSGIYYAYETNNSKAIISTRTIYKVLAILILIITLVFTIFTMLLFSNYINISILNNKKQIGILRAIGSSKKDIKKIYVFESIILGVISWVIGVIGWFLVTLTINMFISKTRIYNYYPLVNHPLVPLIMLVYIFVIAYLITNTIISRITKIKPIDVINNK